MTDKSAIIQELGESGLFLPALVNTALDANERVKYYFTLLQTARERADHPGRGYPDLRFEREAAGVGEDNLDLVVGTAELVSPGIYSIRNAAAIVNGIGTAVREMIAPFVSAGSPHADEFEGRFRALDTGSPGEDVPAGFIDRVVSGDRAKGDSYHILVMDIHKALNAIQAEISDEGLEGASVYLLEDEDRPLVQAFMEGVNRTAPLRFDHPGLGTTATRAKGKLVIQNDIGVTDAHVLVISVEGATVAITYTDIHMQRIQFFQSLFADRGVVWEDTISRRTGKEIERGMYHLTIGTYRAGSPEDLRTFLAFLGSRIVFLIDWNRARKRLRNFLPNRDAIEVLRWAAENEYGHMAFLTIGGERIIYDALELSPRVVSRYGEPLSQIIGTERARDFIRWVLKTTAEGLLAEKSRVLLKDEIRIELMRYFRSEDEDLMEICEEHATLMIETGTVVRDALLAIQRGGDMDYPARGSRRAKRWESRADALLNEVRALPKRIETADLFLKYLLVADDAIDALEEACFYTTLFYPSAGTQVIIKELTGMADLSLKGCQGYLRALIAARNITGGNGRAEMRDFLNAVDRVVGIEHACDEALRKARRTIILSSTDHQELFISFELARLIEESTNFLMKAVFVMRDSVLERVVR